MELLSDFPGEAILWLIILGVALFWGRRQEKKKRNRYAKNHYK